MLLFSFSTCSLPVYVYLFIYYVYLLRFYARVNVEQ
jgi:hypothetical protein